MEDEEDEEGWPLPSPQSSQVLSVASGGRGAAEEDEEEDTSQDMRSPSEEGRRRGVRVLDVDFDDARRPRTAPSRAADRFTPVQQQPSPSDDNQGGSRRGGAAAGVLGVVGVRPQTSHTRGRMQSRFEELKRRHAKQEARVDSDISTAIAAAVKAAKTRGESEEHTAKAMVEAVESFIIEDEWL